MAGSWFDLQRPNIPSTTPRAPVAPVPAGGTITGLAGNSLASTVGGVTGTGVAVPGQEVPLSTAAAPGTPQTGAPASSLAGYTGAPININVPFNPQSFVGSDAYNFLKNEGLNDVTRKHFAKGTGGTGGFAKDLVDYAQGNAATFYGTQLAHDTDVATGNANRTLTGLSSLSSAGLNAAGQQAGYGFEGGNAAAGGTIGAQNAINTGVGAAADSLAAYFAKQRAKRYPMDERMGDMGTPTNPGWYSPWNTAGGG